MQLALRHSRRLNKRLSPKLRLVPPRRPRAVRQRSRRRRLQAATSGGPRVCLLVPKCRSGSTLSKSVLFLERQRERDWAVIRLRNYQDAVRWRDEMSSDVSPGPSGSRARGGAVRQCALDRDARGGWFPFHRALRRQGGTPRRLRRGSARSWDRWAAASIG